MKPYFFRYVIGDAGNIERLVKVVKVAFDFPDTALLQWEVLTERNVMKKKKKSQFKGEFFRPRSYEPHLALARELGIFERGERWRLTISVGVPFLRLWKEGEKKATRFLLLAQLIRYDKWMLIPFLTDYLKHEKKPNEIVVDVWEKMWKTFPSVMELAEPPIPHSLVREEDKKIKRTAGHHALFRKRFLQTDQGLNLNEEQLKRIVECFENYKAPKFPSDYYSKIGFIITGKYPKRCELKNMKNEIYAAFKLFRKLSYASAQAVFHYIHGKILPGHYMDWNEYLHYLRSSGHFNLHSTYTPDDMLFSIKGVK